MVKKGTKSRKGGKRRASSKKRRSRGRGALSILTMLPVVNKAAIEPIFGDGGQVSGALALAQAGNVPGAVREFADVLGINFIGFKFSDGSFWMPKVVDTYKGIALGYVGSKVLTKMGVNRHFQKLPFVGKKWKL